MWGRPLLTLRAVCVECREPRGSWEGVRECVGGQGAEAVCVNFFFRMCAALKEGIVLVIKGRASGNYWRKSVGRREGTRADGGEKNPRRRSRTGGDGGAGFHTLQQALNSTNSSHYSHFSDEESESQRSRIAHMTPRERWAWGGPSVPGY